MVLFGMVLAWTLVSTVEADAPGQSMDWRQEWSVSHGFDVTKDAAGFEFPTAIAFVPDPGSGPKDPLYFVSELKGAVKVVSNDRTVTTFAEDFFRLNPGDVIPEIDDEVGMAGICLDREHGYVFVTFSYHDSENVLRNNVVRFQSTPGTFSLAPTETLDFIETFAPYPSRSSHQIGPCQVNDGLLYVAVADAGEPGRSQQLDTLQGKVLRLTLDGRPALGNPFIADGSEVDASDYIWASGFRNPFGLTMVGDRVFVADNGPAVDRFLEISEGVNYLWDGTDNSMGANADAIFTPSQGVGQMGFNPEGAGLYPSRFDDNFFVAITGSPLFQAASAPAIMAFKYDFNLNRVTTVPVRVLMHLGDRTQVVAGMAFGPNAIYFAPLLPDLNGETAILRLEYNPEANFPFTIEGELNPGVLITNYGCTQCHRLSGQGGNIGPSLDRDELVPRLIARLNAEGYSTAASGLDELNTEPFVSFASARAAVKDSEGLEQVWLWLQYRIQEPRFDNPEAKMPNLGLSNAQARSLATFLSGFEETATVQNATKSQWREFTDWVRVVVPDANRSNAKRYAAAILGIGLIGGAITVAAVYLIIVRLRRRG